MTDEAKLTLTIREREYDVTPPFTNRELHLIKQVSGVRAGEMWQAMQAGDNDVIVALAHIAVKRSGMHRPNLDELWDMPAGEIQVSTFGVEEDDESVPPADAGEPDSPAGS